jgi:hypothetical protein
MSDVARFARLEANIRNVGAKLAAITVAALVAFCPPVFGFPGAPGGLILSPESPGTVFQYAKGGDWKKFTCSRARGHWNEKADKCVGVPRIDPCAKLGGHYIDSLHRECQVGRRVIKG